LLVRGVSGSGKSTYARSLRGYKHIETDMFFLNWLGKYDFDYTRLGEAHDWCQRTTRHMLQSGNNVVVSNTFTQRWEIQPYLDMAEELGISVEIIVMRGRYQNTHNIPDEVIQRQLDRWED
jgi:predicted kinase